MEKIGEVRDKVGRHIKAGDIIVYGHAFRRRAGLRIGKVLKVNTDRDKATFTVMGVDDDWERREPKLNCRKGELLYSTRIIVLEPCQIPKSHKKLLDEVEVLE